MNKDSSDGWNSALERWTSIYTSSFAVHKTKFFWRTGIPSGLGSRYSMTAMELTSDVFTSVTPSPDKPSTRLRKKSGQVPLFAPSLDSSNVTDRTIPVFELFARRYSRPSPFRPCDSTANPGESILISQFLPGNEMPTVSLDCVSCAGTRSEMPIASTVTQNKALQIMWSLPNKVRGINLDRTRL